MQGLILSCFIHRFILVKGTVGVISSHFPLKEWNVRFTTVPLKALYAQNCMRYQSFSLSKFIIFKCGFSLINWKLSEGNTFQANRNNDIFNIFDEKEG